MEPAGVVVAQANKDHIGNIGLAGDLVAVRILKCACIVRTDMRSIKCCRQTICRYPVCLADCIYRTLARRLSGKEAAARAFSSPRPLLRPSAAPSLSAMVSQGHGELEMDRNRSSHSCSGKAAPCKIAWCDPNLLSFASPKRSLSSPSSCPRSRVWQEMAVASLLRLRRG